MNGQGITFGGMLEDLQVHGIISADVLKILKRTVAEENLALLVMVATPTIRIVGGGRTIVPTGITEVPLGRITRVAGGENPPRIVIHGDHILQ